MGAENAQIREVDISKQALKEEGLLPTCTGRPQQAEPCASTLSSNTFIQKLSEGGTGEGKLKGRAK